MRLEISDFKGHVKSLDGLRGLAIILVLLYHIFPYIKIFQIGWIGVDLFFVLSGFLITGILLDTVNHPKYWRNFFGRRVLRIFPLYYFTLILLIVLAILFPSFANHQYVNFDYFSDHQFWFWSYLMNWKILGEGYWLPVIILNIFWSLAIEEQFYIFWPFVVLLFKNKLPLFIIIMGPAILIFRVYLAFNDIWDDTAIYTNTLTRIDTILIGALIAYGVRKVRWRSFFEKFTLPALAVIIVLFLILLFFARGFHPFNSYIMAFGYTLIYLSFGCLLIVIIQDGRKLSFLKRLFENRILTYFGKYSYSMYVYHWALFMLLFDELVKVFSTVSGNEQVIKLASSITIFFAVLIVSQITWFGFEKRFLKLKRLFRY